MHLPGCARNTLSAGFCMSQELLQPTGQYMFFYHTGLKRAPYRARRVYVTFLTQHRDFRRFRDPKRHIFAYGSEIRFTCRLKQALGNLKTRT